MSILDIRDGHVGESTSYSPHSTGQTRVANMRIGFDVSPLVWPTPRGVVRATRGLVEALERRRVLEIVRLEPPSASSSIVWRQISVSRAVREFDLHGLHSPVSAFPLRANVPVVSTVHEIPWRVGARERSGLVPRFWASVSANAATVCPSEFTASALHAHRGGRRPVVIAPWGVDLVFTSPAQGDMGVLERHGLFGRPFVLCVGATRAKKNLAAVLRGVAELDRRRAQALAIVVTGPITRDLESDRTLARALELEKRFLAVGEVSDAELAALYRSCACTVVLSHSEGFAFPVVEALASGAPVVVSRASAQAELAGALGIAVDAQDPTSVADGLSSALEARRHDDPARRERALTFTWDRCAERIETLWKSLA